MTIPVNAALYAADMATVHRGSDFLVQKFPPPAPPPQRVQILGDDIGEDFGYTKMPRVVGVVLTVSPVSGKPNLRELVVDVGAAEPLTVVTNAPNVREGTRTVVATVGTELEVNGEIVTVKRVSVGGIMSSGIICDSAMCGWVGGGAGIAVQVPADLALGSPAPASKPRLGGVGDAAAADAPPEMSDKELKAKEKAERKAAAAAKKEARKAAKQSGEAVEGEEAGEDDT